MRRTFLVQLIVGFLLALPFRPVYAESELDSLESLLPFANDVQRVDLLNGIALNLRSSDTTKAGIYARQAYALSGKINFCKGKATAAVILGILQKNRNNFLEAQRYYLEGLSLGLKCKEPYSVSLAYHSLGNLAYFKNNFPVALRYYLASLKLSEQLGDYRRVARTLNNIGSLYMELSNTNKAEEYYQKSLELHKLLGDPLLVAELSNNLANIYQAKGLTMNALHYYLNALTVFREKGSAYDVSTALNNIGTIYNERGQYQKAIPYLMESYQIDVKMKDEKSTLPVFLNLGDAYFHLRKLDSAIYFGKLALTLADKLNAEASKVSTYKLLADVYQAKGDKESARKFREMAQAIETGAGDVLRNNEVNSIQAQYENEKKEARIKLLAKEKEIQDLKIREQELELKSKNTWLLVMGIGLIFLFVLGGLAFYSWLLLRQRNSFELSNRAKSNILLQINHELRTPLNAIAGMSQLAVESKTFNELKEYLANIRLSSDELLFVLNNLIAYLQIDRNENKPVLSPFKFIESLEESFKTFELRAKSKGLYFQSMVYPGIPDVANGDRQKINTILHNLIVNAIQNTPKGSVKVEVKPTAVREKDGVKLVNIHFAVSDEGKGLSAKEIKSIFKGVIKDSSNANGFGIGLKNVKDICEKMGGHIEVISEPGNGSTFIVEFELEELNPDLAFGLTSKPATNAQVKPRVLIVEDNQLNQRLMAKILEKEGFDFRIAENGREALHILIEKKFDLILMDIRMPEMDGIQTCWNIRNDSRYHAHSQVPIIAVTAHDDAEEKKKCLSSGMNDYVTKPFSKELLVQKIRVLLA